MQYAPDWTITAGYAHDVHFDGGYVRASASTRYEGSFYADYVHTPGGRQQSYHKTDASLTYYPERGSWSLGLWVKNIENVAVLAATRRRERHTSPSGGCDGEPGSTPNLRHARHLELLINRLEGES